MFTTTKLTKFRDENLLEQEIPVGSTVKWTTENAVITTPDNRELKVRFVIAVKALGIKRPSFSELEDWQSEGGCESVYGNWVEPDGYDEHGSPSWLIILGYI